MESENSSEVERYQAKLAALRSAIDEADASGIAQGNPFKRVRKVLKLSGNSRRPAAPRNSG
jgi:hypothetical protein